MIQEIPEKVQCFGCGKILEYTGEDAEMVRESRRYAGKDGTSGAICPVCIQRVQKENLEVCLTGQCGVGLFPRDHRCQGDK